MNNGFDLNKFWMKQSEIFFNTANEHLQSLFSQQTNADPEDYLEKMKIWQAAYSQQWQNFIDGNQSEKYKQYYDLFAEMNKQAYDVMLKEWKRRSAEDNPIASLNELFELWVNACHESYQQLIKANHFQQMYGDMISEVLKSWR